MYNVITGIHITCIVVRVYACTCTCVYTCTVHVHVWTLELVAPNACTLYISTNNVRVMTAKGGEMPLCYTSIYMYMYLTIIALVYRDPLLEPLALIEFK